MFPLRVRNGGIQLNNHTLLQAEQCDDVFSCPLVQCFFIPLFKDQGSILAIVLTLCTWRRDFVVSHIAYVVSTYDGPAVKLRKGVINFVTLTRLSPLSWWSGFKLSVKSNQAITLALVLVLPRFEVVLSSLIVK